jgi:hypothetical protein
MHPLHVFNAPDDGDLSALFKLFVNIDFRESGFG